VELPPFPPELLRRLDGYEVREETAGLSGAGVFRLLAANRPSLIAKLAAGPEAAALFSEAARLRWLCSSGVLAPEVLAVAEAQGYVWLIMECLPGENAVDSIAPPAARVRQLAIALHKIHALDAQSCPFDETVGAKLARAKLRMKLNQVDEEDLENQTGMTAARLLRELEQLRPATEDVVVTHGDACLENIMLNGGRFSGFVDCGRVGRSDRYQDLALACRSISEQIGAEWIEPFLRIYGVASLDMARARFYVLLDELF
jgi:aminoglycoside 3'-phosphotransferase-2